MFLAILMQTYAGTPPLFPNKEAPENSTVGDVAQAGS
jgi:hypothetical protein